MAFALTLVDVGEETNQLNILIWRGFFSARAVVNFILDTFAVFGDSTITNGTSGDIEKDHIQWSAVYKKAVGRSSGNGGRVPEPESQRVGSDPLRTPGLDNAKWQVQGSVVFKNAGTT